VSTRYPGGIITKTPVVPTGPYESGTAPGIWTLDQQLQAQKAGIWPLAGNPVPYIEDMFSTYLVTPTTSNTTYSVTNGIDVSGKGGMVWMKARSAGSTNNLLYDTVRGASSIANNALISNSSSAQQTANFDYITGLSNGFTVNFASGGGQLTNNGINYVSWTFREQPKFFDIVTYTGDGVAGLNINHNLGSAPGCMFVKRTDATGSWHVFHTSLGGTKTLFLNGTNAAVTNIRYWDDTAPTSTVFTLGYDTDVNASGGTYVAYLFAHNAGGFGLTGTDNVISCGSFTPDGSGNATVNLGYEPQWVLWKYSTAVEPWYIFDNMRGWTASNTMADLRPNTTAAEVQNNSFYIPTATGFSAPATLAPSSPIIYIAIRRGPMAVPTDATKVYGAVSRAGTGANATVTTGSFPPDLTIIRGRDAGYSWRWGDRLRGTPAVLRSNLTNAELTGETDLSSFNMDGFSLTGTGASLSNSSGANYINYAMGRAPGFFDEVCYTGTGVTRTVTHNLGVAPELMIVKSRSGTGDWKVWNKSSLFTNLILNSDVATQSDSINSPTTTTFSAFADSNTSSVTYVAYLFATVAGVSKVGSYTGTGTTLQINCGFTAGSRFVLIKRTDSTGDWYVWDSARGIVAGNDPYLLLNSTAAEVTGTDYVDTYSAGFEISSTAPAAINANGGTYIFLAIA